MADGNSSGFLGAIVGALLVGLIGMGGFLFLSQKPAPPAASIKVSLSAAEPSLHDH